jgi:hypothetical protein
MKKNVVILMLLVLSMIGLLSSCTEDKNFKYVEHYYVDTCQNTVTVYALDEYELKYNAIGAFHKDAHAIITNEELVSLVKNPQDTFMREQCINKSKGGFWIETQEDEKILYKVWYDQKIKNFDQKIISMGKETYHIFMGLVLSILLVLLFFAEIYWTIREDKKLDINHAWVIIPLYHLIWSLFHLNALLPPNTGFMLGFIIIVGVAFVLGFCAYTIGFLTRLLGIGIVQLIKLNERLNQKAQAQREETKIYEEETAKFLAETQEETEEKNTP